MSSPSLHAPPASPAHATACRVLFGQGSAEIGRTHAATLGIALPVLAGASEETLLAAAQTMAPKEGFALFRHADRLAGFAVADATDDLENAAVDLYRRLFALTDGLHLHRIWNYVPAINAIEGGLENYRRFCRGRSLAFEQRFGRDFRERLPAASGVGAVRGPLAVAFLAGKQTPRHFENPQQVPAFHYPAQYGPRPPSFSRATLVRVSELQQQLFISGTAAILGHETVAAGNLQGQLEATLQNLRVVGAAAGMGDRLATGTDCRRTFKVYLRHAADAAPTQSYLQRALLQPGDGISYLHADLCRSDLLVEIEAVLESR